LFCRCPQDALSHKNTISPARLKRQSKGILKLENYEKLIYKVTARDQSKAMDVLVELVEQASDRKKYPPG
jgi:hypothetical protein